MYFIISEKAEIGVYNGYSKKYCGGSYVFKTAVNNCNCDVSFLERINTVSYDEEVINMDQVEKTIKNIIDWYDHSTIFVVPMSDYENVLDKCRKLFHRFTVIGLNEDKIENLTNYDIHDIIYTMIYRDIIYSLPEEVFTPYFIVDRDDKRYSVEIWESRVMCTRSFETLEDDTLIRIYSSDR